MGNEKGWVSKYDVLKVDGSPVDAAADYFVLRLDKDETARVAAEVYAERTTNLALKKDLRIRLEYWRTRDEAERATIEFRKRFEPDCEIDAVFAE